MRALACDLGGTNVRFGLGVDGRLDPETVVQFPNERFSDFGTALKHYFGQVRVGRVERAVVALAAPIDGDTICLTNRNWTIARAEIAEIAGTGDVVLINDFVALGAALSRAEALVTRPVLPGAAGRGVKLVLGAGTGFNASALIEGGHVLAAEIGHTGFAPEPGLETALRDHFAGRFGRCSLDRVLSGSGLVALYRVACDRSGRAAALGDAAAVTAEGAAGRDADAVLACGTLAGMLGRTAGDLALTFLPRGGIYLTGGVTGALAPFIQGPDSPFARAFLAKGRMRELMRGFTLDLVMDQSAALVGCLAWPDLPCNTVCGGRAAGPT
ncbi:glucokinase [Nitratireductor alexandrii]|uniref:glucokinase n=1 Tax=Nitratireductor alexandrii TaxID=2448161 RepID=UPI000FDB131D|nr:glucokinase [Nitratireductor alexandrii]